MSSKEIITKFIDTLRVDVINSMQSSGQSATGQTAAQLQIYNDESDQTLTGPFWIDTLEFGRKPTKPGAPAGTPTVYENIVAWATAKGIPEFETNDKGQKINVWRAITAHIHKYGYEGKPGVLSAPLGDDNVNNRLADTMEQLASMEVENMIDTVISSTKNITGYKVTIE